MAPRPSDVKRVAELLLEPADDVDTLARSVIETLDALRAERVGYVVVSVTPPGVAWSYGVYPTAHQAERAISKGVGVVDGGRTGVLAVYPLRTIVGAPETGCQACPHPKAAHGWPKSKINGCVVRDCACEWSGR